MWSLDESMELTFHLDGECIETVAENEYEELAKSLLEKDDREKEEKLEFLRKFLKNSDFNELRSDGFDGSEEMVVKVTKEDKRFRVERV